MRILLTGAGGEIGTPLLDALHEKGHELVALTRRERSSPTIRWVRGDVTDAASLARALDECGSPEVVVHMAAVTHAKKARDYDAVNVDGTANLLRALAQRDDPPKHFVHLSSRAVGAHGGAYCASKLRSEELVRASSLPFTILRPAEVYGSGGDDAITSLERTLRDGRFVPVIGDGRYTVAPVHADDVTAAIGAAVELPGAGRTYVLAGPESLTFLGLIAHLETRLGVPRRRRVFVPVWCARMMIRVGSALGVGGYVPDQVDRLLLDKSVDISAAQHDLGFDPRPLG